MGQYSQHRPTCESSCSLDIRLLSRVKVLDPGKAFKFGWQCNGETKTAAVRFNLHDLQLFILRPGRYPLEQRIGVTWSACAYGGKRPWFTCMCGRRAAIVYLAGPLFACRHCYRLTYSTQHLDPHGRAIRMRRKIRERLNGSLDLTAPFPERPKGMHDSTYSRLRLKSLRAEQREYGAMIDFLRRYHRNPCRAL